MSTWRRELIELALDIVERICRNCDDDCKKRFRTRARNLVADIYTSGVAYVISVVAARSSAAAVEIGLSANSVDEIIKVCSDSRYARNLGLEKAEEYSYALYGASLLYALKSTGILSANSLDEAISSLLENVIADRVALHVAMWLKRFAEAYIHE